MSHKKFDFIGNQIKLFDIGNDFFSHGSVLVDPATGEPYSLAKTAAKQTLSGPDAATLATARLISGGNAASISKTVVIDGSLYE